MAEVDQSQVIDTSKLDYNEAVQFAMTNLDMSEPEAVLYVWITKGLVEGDTY